MAAALTIAAAAAEWGVLLTPKERWQAARRMETEIISQPWFSTVLLVLLVVLGALFVAVCVCRAASRLRTAHEAFAEYARRRGLTEKERQTAIKIAAGSGIKYSAGIFADSAAFDRGASRMLERNIQEKRSGRYNKELSAEIARLREKLGFRVRSAASVGQVRQAGEGSSRQLGVGKEVQIVSSQTSTNGMSAAKYTIVGTDDFELMVKSEPAVQLEAGQECTVRYELGAAYWEFDTAVISCTDGVVVLSHSDDVRLINRRRFKRISVKAPAMVAAFPFARKQDRTEGIEVSVPVFVPATVTEVAGLRLIFQSELKAAAGDRVVILFDLGDGGPSQVIEDIGVIRNVRAGQEGTSITVELTGLSDSDVNELIRLTGSGDADKNTASAAAEPEQQLQAAEKG